MKAMLINAMSTIGVVTALVLLILSAALFCNERGFHPLGKNAQRFRELTWFEKLFFAFFVSVITALSLPGGISVAAYWDSLRLRGGTTNDAINVRSDVDTAGFDYPVGEWANEGFVVGTA